MRGIIFILILLLALFTTTNVGSEEELIEIDDWYKTQIGTGIGNCGPASTAMAIYWSTGRDLSVQRVRRYIGNPYAEGAVTFFNIMGALNHWGADARYQTFNSLEEVEDALDRSSIIMFLFKTSAVEITDGSQYGRTYSYNGGHYAIIHDHYRDWFVVNDPMWAGKDRLYEKDQIAGFLDKVVVIEKVY